MNSRTLVILLAALAVLTALAIAVSVSQRPETTTGGPLLPGLHEQLNDVNKIVLRTGGNKTVATLEKRAGGWIVAERAGHPADVGRIRKNLLALAEAKKIEEKTSSPELYGRLKVEDIKTASAGGLQLDITTGEQTTGVILGATGVGGGDRAYARLSGDLASWLVTGSFDLPRDASEWLDRVIVNLPSARVRAVSISHPDGKVLRVEDPATNPIGNALADLRFEGVVPAAEFSPGDAKPVVARFEFIDGLVIEAQSWQQPAGVRLQLSASADETLRTAAAPPTADQTPAAATPPSTAKESTPVGESVKPFAEVQTEAAELQKRLANWVYTVPEFRAEPLRRREASLSPRPSHEPSYDQGPASAGPPRP